MPDQFSGIFFLCVFQSKWLLQKNPPSVTHPITMIFDGSNYDLWPQEICTFLKGRLLWRILTGEVVKPTRQDHETRTKFIERLDQLDNKNY